MSKVRVKLNSAGVRELLRSDEASKVCKVHADRIAQACGDGYASDTYIGRNRVNAMAYAKTKEAYQDNLENNTLLKAV